MGLREVFSVEGAELDCFRDMRAPNLLASVEVGDGSRHTEDPVIAACGETESVKGFFQNILCHSVKFAVFSDLNGGKGGIAIEIIFILIPFLCEFPCAIDFLKDDS